MYLWVYIVILMSFSGLNIGCLEKNGKPRSEQPPNPPEGADDELPDVAEEIRDDIPPDSKLEFEIVLTRSNEAEDGFINTYEKAGHHPLFHLSVSENLIPDTALYTDLIPVTGSCSDDLDYLHNEIPSASSLPNLDGSYIICVRISDVFQRFAFQMSPPIIRDTGSPEVQLSHLPPLRSFDENIEIIVSGEEAVSYHYHIINQLDADCEQVLVAALVPNWREMTDPIVASLNTDGHEKDFTICVFARDLARNVTIVQHSWSKIEAWFLKLTISQPGQTFRISLAESELELSWGDGSIDMTSSTDTEYSHVYREAGQYTLAISGSAKWMSFKNQGALSEIISPINGITGIVSFKDTFYNCVNLKGKIPDRLFNSQLEAKTFEGTFALTKSLSGPIPSNLFRENVNVTSFRRTFYGSEIGGRIPEKLFETNILAVTFESVFELSKVNRGIPPQLFSNNINAVNFERAFSYTDINSIPADLFKGTNGNNFSKTFLGSHEINSIPVRLFDGLSPTSFHRTFFGLFKVRGAVPRLWETYNLPPSATEGCFAYVADNIDEGGEIPSDWK